MDGIVGNEHQEFCFVDLCNVLEALHIELSDFCFHFVCACSCSLTLSSEISSTFGAKDVSCFRSFHTCSVEAWLVILYSFEEVSNIFGLLQVLLNQFLAQQGVKTVEAGSNSNVL